MGAAAWNTWLGQIRRLVGGATAEVSTDRHLLRRFVEDHDQDAFAEVVHRHGPLVLSACRRLLPDLPDAEDAFQATFCVLARRAGTVAWQESVGTWLYAVAYRIARKARANAVRRRQQEKEAAAMRSETSTPPAAEFGLAAVLDDELMRLPERYRVPLVLCYLQGHTNEEAANQLGCPKGTLQSQLARGRDMLRSRLERRGLALGAAGLGMADAARATVSNLLLQNTIQHSIQFAAGGATTGAIPAAVTQLAEGALRTMWLTKVKIAAVVVLVLGMTGAGAGVFLGRPGDGPATASAAPLSTERRQAASGEPIRFLGGITDPDRRLVFLNTPNGGIQAVRLEDGKALWTNENFKAEPLLVAGRLLVAGSQPLFVLDLQQEGKLIRQCDPIPYPKLESPFGCTLSFHLHAPRVVDGVLQARWFSWSTIIRKGSVPDPRAWKNWQIFGSAAPGGTVKINLETGRAEMETSPKPVNVFAEGIAPTAEKAIVVPREFPAKLGDAWLRYRDGERQHVLQIGDRVIGVAWVGPPADFRPAVNKVVFHSMNLKTGKVAQPVELVNGDVFTVKLTADRRHLLVGRTKSPGLIFSLETGECVCKTVSEQCSVHGGLVEGKRFYSDVPGHTTRVLKAFDLPAGKIAWERLARALDGRDLPWRD